MLSGYYRGLNNCQYHFEVHKEYGAIILVILGYPISGGFGVYACRVWTFWLGTGSSWVFFCVCGLEFRV